MLVHLQYNAVMISEVLPAVFPNTCLGLMPGVQALNLTWKSRCNFVGRQGNHAMHAVLVILQSARITWDLGLPGYRARMQRYLPLSIVASPPPPMSPLSHPHTRMTVTAYYPAPPDRFH